MTIGVLAIAGIPPLSGFVSKDEILHHVSHSHRWWLMLFAFGTAFLTSFYMGRLWVMTFFGKFRGHHEAHESPVPMTFVLVTLAILSAVVGFLNWPELWGGGEHLHHYLGTIVSQAEGEITEHAFSSSLQLAILSSLIGLAGLSLAYFRYRNFSGEEFKSPAFRLFKNKYYVDEIYNALIVRNLKGLGYIFWKAVDGFILDGILDGLANFSRRLSERFRNLQTGLTQQYALWVWVGFLILLVGAWSIH
jgi:NADH-quinone oxidoreductase subunit L